VRWEEEYMEAPEEEYALTGSRLLLARLLVVLWRCFLLPLVFSLVTLPMSILVFPIGIIYMVITAVLLHFAPVLAILFVAVVSVGYAYYFWPSRRWLAGYQSLPGKHYPSIVGLVGTLVAFLLCLLFLPAFQPVLRFVAALGIAYYAAAVAKLSVQELCGLRSEL
jgi:hypothetical protein